MGCIQFLSMLSYLHLLSGLFHWLLKILFPSSVRMFCQTKFILGFLNDHFHWGRLRNLFLHLWFEYKSHGNIFEIVLIVESEVEPIWLYGQMTLFKEVTKRNFIFKIKFPVVIYRSLQLLTYTKSLYFNSIQVKQ